MTKGYSLERILEVIDGSAGITLTVAQRLGCDWLTAKRYIAKWEATKKAFAAEGEKILDVAESVLERNIRIAYQQQRNPETGETQIVDTGDVKWLLSRKGKARGYADKSEVELAGKDGGPIIIRGIDPDGD